MGREKNDREWKKDRKKISWDFPLTWIFYFQKIRLKTFLQKSLIQKLYIFILFLTWNKIDRITYAPNVAPIYLHFFIMSL